MLGARMRHRLPIIIWLFTCACGLAQQQEKKLMDRLTGTPDMSLRNTMDGKPFNGGGTMDFSKKTAAQTTFVYDQKLKPQGYTTRSFFGLKNPWFGKKIESADASVWSKTIVENADRKVAVDNVKMTEFATGEKKASIGNGVVLQPQFVPKSGTPGAMDQINSQLQKKNMTIDQVRDLLNKN